MTDYHDMCGIGTPKKYRDRMNIGEVYFNGAICLRCGDLIRSKNCHDFNNWMADKFDHNNALFKLDGKHQDVACKECHKLKITEQIKYVQYKFEDISCESCH